MPSGIGMTTTGKTTNGHLQKYVDNKAGNENVKDKWEQELNEQEDM